MKRNELVVDSYFNMLKHLSMDDKLDLIARLSKSMQKKRVKENDSIDSLYGSFVSSKSADEIIEELKQDRTKNKERVSF